MIGEKINVKAMCLFEHDGKVLLTKGHDSVKEEDFYRVPGGHVEFCESAEQAVRREIKEELQSEIENLKFLQAVENIFDYNGKRGHEITFLYSGELANKSLLERQRIQFLEDDGSEHEAQWVALKDIKSGQARVYPKACLSLV